MDRHRATFFAFGLLFVLLSAALLVSQRTAEVDGGKFFPAADSVVWGVVLTFMPLGVTFMMYAAYERKWRIWPWLSRARAVVLGGALVFFCLSAADVLTVWTTGFSYSQALVGANTTLLEGIPLREWVTELGFGALLTVVGLLLDLAER